MTNVNRKRRTRAEIIADLQAKEDAAQRSQMAREQAEAVMRHLRARDPKAALLAARTAVHEIELLIEREAQAKREQELRSPQTTIEQQIEKAEVATFS